MISSSVKASQIILIPFYSRNILYLYDFFCPSATVNKIYELLPILNDNNRRRHTAFFLNTIWYCIFVPINPPNCTHYIGIVLYCLYKVGFLVRIVSSGTRYVILLYIYLNTAMVLTEITILATIANNLTNTFSYSFISIHFY